MQFSANEQRKIVPHSGDIENRGDMKSNITFFVSRPFQRDAGLSLR